MSLILDGHVIKKDIKSILTKLKLSISNGKLSNIQYKGDEVAITCPFHKNGQEHKPSCFIFTGTDDSLRWGQFHCFTCDEKGSLVHFIEGVLECTYNEAKEWLKDNFTESVIQKRVPIAEPIKHTEEEAKNYLDESVLENFQSWHPYIEQRHISKEIAERFQVKYEPATQCIVFPVREPLTNKLLFLTKRSTVEKKFYIDTSAKKTVYLLNEAIKCNYRQIIVAESQINALVAYSYGFPAIALFGAGTTKDQIKELSKTDIKHYILMYDNDEAGRKGAERFKQFIRDDVFVDDIVMPLNKDVADLSKEEFYGLLDPVVGSN